MLLVVVDHPVECGDVYIYQSDSVSLFDTYHCIWSPPFMSVAPLARLSLPCWILYGFFHNGTVTVEHSVCWRCIILYSGYAVPPSYIASFNLWSHLFDWFPYTMSNEPSFQLKKVLYYCSTTVCLGSRNKICSYFLMFLSKLHRLQDMNEKWILVKDEHLILVVGGYVAFSIFWALAGVLAHPEKRQFFKCFRYSLNHMVSKIYIRHEHWCKMSV